MMASSAASGTSSMSSPISAPLSPAIAGSGREDNAHYDDEERVRSVKVKRLRKRKLNSDSASPLGGPVLQQPQKEKVFSRNLKGQRNRTLQRAAGAGEGNQISNFLEQVNSDSSASSSSSCSEQDGGGGESAFQQQRQGRQRRRRLGGKTNRIIPPTFATTLTLAAGATSSNPTFSKKSTVYPHSDANFTGEQAVEEHENLRVSFPQAYSNSSSVHLEWKGQPGQLTREISKYFEIGTFVDVTLICDGSGTDEDGIDRSREHDEQLQIGTHKIVLASHSDYFSKILEETPSKHAVMFLKGFSKWEVEALLTFMYTGEVKVDPKQVSDLCRAAAALQIRGVAECLERVSSGESPPQLPNLHQSCQNEEVKDGGGQGLPGGLLNLSLSTGRCPSANGGEEVRNGPQTTRAHRPGFPIHHQHQHLHQPSQPPPPFTQQQTTASSSPPFPRRKQARPRRRSGDFVAQDLRLTPPVPPPEGHGFFGPTDPPFGGFHFGGSKLRNSREEDDVEDETVLDFTISHHNRRCSAAEVKQETKGLEKFLEGVEMGMKSQHFSRNWLFPPLAQNSLTPPPPPMLHRRSPQVKTESEFEGISPLEPESVSPPDNFRGQLEVKGRSKRSFSTGPNFNGSFKGSPPSPSSFLLNFNINPNGNGFLPPLPHQHNSDSESNNADPCSTPPPHTSSPPLGASAVTPPSSSGGGSPKKQRNGDSGAGGAQTWAGLALGPAPIFGRHRAQHSAPRGGPPRAWSNADLTEALHNVWNKKMTTSQASRIFGIPYNSLLMYVRGKYGKSLHLDVLKKGVDMALENSAAAAAASKNAGSKSKGQQPSTGRGSTSPGSSPSSNNATPPHNNNNNTITPKGSKGKSGVGGSPPPSAPQGNLSLNNLLGQGLSGVGSPEPIRLTRHHSSPESNAPLGDVMPPGFNPFSIAGIFGDYPPPFPFSSVAAANAALSHILPPHHPHHILTNSHRRVHHNGPSEK